MIDGVKVCFRKDKMIARVTAAGKADMIDAEVMAMMDNLDGCEASASCWERVVKGAPVYWVVGKDGNGAYVADVDCD